METIKIRATAKHTIQRRYAVQLFGVKLAVAFDRDSGAKVGYNAIMLSGSIDSGGSRKNWYCVVREGSVFELEVDQEAFDRNKNRIKNWDIEIISEFMRSKERAKELEQIEANLE